MGARSDGSDDEAVGSAVAAEPVHRFGRPLPPGPRTLADAVGVGVRSMLGGWGVLWLPLLVWVALSAYDESAKLVVCCTLVLLVGALWADASWRWRAAAVGLSVAAAALVRPEVFPIPLPRMWWTCLVCALVVPGWRRTWWVLPLGLVAVGVQWDLLRALEIGAAALTLGAPPFGPSYSAELNLSLVGFCIALFAAARVAAWRSVVVLLVLAWIARTGVVPWFSDVRDVPPELVVALFGPVVAGCCARLSLSVGATLGDAIAWFQRSYWLRILPLCGLIAWVGAAHFEVAGSTSLVKGSVPLVRWSVRAFRGGGSLTHPMTPSETAHLPSVGGLGLALAVAVFVCAWRRAATVMGMAAALALPVVVGATLVASEPVLRAAFSGWSGEVVSSVGRVGLGLALGSTLGWLLALVVRSAPAPLLASLVYLLLYVSVVPSEDVPGTTRLALRVGLLALVVCWGSGTQRPQRYLVVWLVVAAALAAIDPVQDALSPPDDGQETASFLQYRPPSGWELWGPRVALAARALALHALCGVLIAQAIHFARAFGSMTAIPAWHAVRADFEGDGDEGGATT